MEFIRETLEAFDELDPLSDDGSLQDQLTRTAARVQLIAPELAGMSIASREQGLTFTLVASDDEVATLDAVQYLDSGPCVEALDHGQGIATSEGGLLDEARWRELAIAGAAKGVRSTLTFPIMSRGETVGTVNLYGRFEDSFVGKHEALAAAVGGWAAGAVTNADLSFSTIEEARRAPTRLRNDTLVDTATGIVAASRDVSIEEARERLADAATRAGVPLTTLARAIVDLHDHDDR
jgi:GAF domain-containing protein